MPNPSSLRFVFKTITIVPPQRVRSKLVDEFIIETDGYREWLLGKLTA